MQNVSATIVGVVAMIIGLATLAVILSPKATTSQVIGTSSTGLANLINAATSPVTGGGSFSAFSPAPSLSMYG
jgi:PRD1 phage membrane DNA delivery